MENVAGERPRSAESLGLLYQGLLTSIVRLQSGRQHITDGVSFRNRTKSTIAEIERVAVATGYEPADVGDTHFAVVAFLDEVILNSSDPVRADWERRMLQEELFGKTDAGMVFFDKLATLQSRRDTHRLADILEVYLLCLLLGFQGRYSGPQKGGIESLTAGLVQRIHSIRGRNRELSPDGIPGSQPAVPPAIAAPKSTYFVEITLGAIAITALLFIIYYWNLSLMTDRVLQTLGSAG